MTQNKYKNKINLTPIYWGVLLVPLFAIAIGTKGVYSQVRRQVNECTITQTTCAVPACIDRATLTGLDWVKMENDDLYECTEKAIAMDCRLTVTTYYPQMPRWENDYQYMIGKSVTSNAGTTLYAHNGEELIFQPSEEGDESFTLVPELCTHYGIYNSTFTVPRMVAITNLQNAGFYVYEREDGFLVGVSERVEVFMHFQKFITETRFFTEEDRTLTAIHRTNYIKAASGHIIPASETMTTYDLLPSGFPYQTTRTKTYLHYEVIQNGQTLVKRENYEFLENLDTTEIEEDDFFDFITQELANYAAGNEDQDITLFPNPANEQITIVFPEYMQQNVNIKVFNRMGYVVMTQQHYLGTEKSLQIHFLPEGYYVIRCTKGNNIISKVFIKE